MREIKRVAVLGSGVMGGAIANLLANCGVPALMLDIVPPSLAGNDDRDKGGRKSLGTSKPGVANLSFPPSYFKSDFEAVHVGDDEADIFVSQGWEPSTSSATLQQVHRCRSGVFALDTESWQTRRPFINNSGFSFMKLAYTFPDKRPNSRLETCIPSSVHNGQRGKRERSRAGKALALKPKTLKLPTNHSDHASQDRIPPIHICPLVVNTNSYGGPPTTIVINCPIFLQGAGRSPSNTITNIVRSIFTGLGRTVIWLLHLMIPSSN